jgi:hypothetical protein
MSEGERFVKLDASGNDLPADAAEWAAVRDNTLQLIWDAQETAEMTHADAEEHVASLTVCGKPARLPSVEELFSLADRTKLSPAIDTTFFPKCQSDWYWTSTRHAGSPSDCAWFVHFYYGYSYVYNRHYKAFVRACRPSQ